MIGKIPKYREGRPLPKGYIDPPDPYRTPEPSDINIRMLIEYAKETGKDSMDLTYEEVRPFIRQPV